MKATGKFITFEGIDGAGKSTHIAYVAERLRQALSPRGVEVISSREPGGTPLGETLREVLLQQKMHLETEALLMFAVRREHIAQVIQPALERGDWVISDRFTDASFAYQGGGRHLSLDKLNALEQWVHPDLQPDLTLLFDVPLAVARARLDATRELDSLNRKKRIFLPILAMNICAVRQNFLSVSVLLIPPKVSLLSVMNSTASLMRCYCLQQNRIK
jgi:dTMP kinase